MHFPQQAYPLNQPIFEAKTIIVTGAGSVAKEVGIGRAIAISAVLAGANVVVVDKNESFAKTTADMLGDGHSHQVLVVQADTTRTDDCRRVAQQALRKFGTIDHLVNNVGILGPEGTALEVNIDSWNIAMGVNLNSALIMSQNCLPHMIAHGRGGSILNLTSTAGMRGGHPFLFYPTSKGAILNFTRAMAAQHGRQGIRVNSIAPGMVETPMVGGSKMSEDRRKQRQEESMLGTPGSAWDIAKAALFLMSDDARWITGINLPVDAGLTAGVSRPPVDVLS